MTRKLANGILCFGPATFVSIAFVLSQFGSKGCHYLSFSNPDDVVTVFNRNQVLGAGFTCFGAEDGVELYYPENLPFSEEAIFVQNMGLATTVMGATAWGLYIIASCFRFPPSIWMFLSVLLVATCICEGLCFTFFNAPVCDIADCGLGKSSRCSLSAVVFWAVSSVMTCAVFKDAQDRYNEENEQEAVGDEG